MKADTTRATFKKTKHYNGVLMQQGRVQLDADWNEQIDITRHRVETETIDVVGRCGAPMHEAGFHIVASANDLTAEEKTLPENQNPPAVGVGDLLISGGRYYVDGILCENERTVAYTKQPDLPDGQPVTAAGTYLAYIDVWARHITALEDASIREVALGGPDTATRSKTVWQVKLFQVGDINLAANCSTAFASWDAEIAAGTGKLAARAAVSTPSNDPCIVAPGAGYRRLENQHYRVEVHDKGNLGTATFKWSRDNGSVVTKWEAQNVNDLTVSSIGRDKVLSFASGQWVELIDDTLELLGKPGTLVQLVKAEGNVLTINPATATGPTNIASFPRNPRVRRWDMAALLKPNNQNWLDLEDGVQAHLTAGSYKTGDYWLIPARTATADVEWFIDPVTNQPATQLPFGIEHHYCRLAIAKFDGTIWTSIIDCRHIFPPLTELTPGCCTVVVRPGEDIQAAIDSLPETGGCVCLKVGDHEVHAPIRIERSKVALHGETLGARVVRKDGPEVLRIAHPDGLLLEQVTVSGISFELATKDTQGQGIQAMVAMDRCRNATLERCVLHARGLSQIAGVGINRSSDVDVTNCQVDNVRYGLVTIADVTGLTVVGNSFDAATGGKSDGGLVGLSLQGVASPARIEQNRVLGFIFGIVLNEALSSGIPFSLATGSRITGNYIVRLGAQLEVGTFKAFGIDVAADDCIISDNILLYNSPEYGGISVSGRDAVVERNQLHSLLKEAGSVRPIALLLARLGKNGSLGSIGGRIAANLVLGVQDGIVVIGNEEAEVLDNRVESDGQEVRFGILLAFSSRVQLQGNRVTNTAWPVATSAGTANVIVDNSLVRGGGGVTVVFHTSLTCSQNRVEDMRDWGVLCLVGFAKCALTENRVLNCGYQQSPSIGIGASQQLGELCVESCEVMNTGLSPDNATVSALSWGIIADLILEARVQSNLVTYANAALLEATQEHRALWMRGWLEQVITFGAGQVVFGFSAQILDNKFLGPGRSALVEVAQQTVSDNLFRRFERLFFSNNFCWHASVTAQGTATVSLAARSAIVMGNHIKTNVPIPSVDFHGMKDAVYMGNLAQANPVNFGGIPAPISGFNKP